MINEFEICKIPKCEIEITGIIEKNGVSTYAETFSSTPGEFTFLDTMTINGIYKINSTEEEILEDVSFCDHTQQTIDNVLYNVPDVTKYKFTFDGHYKIVHMIIPKISWLNKFIEIYSPEELYVVNNLNVTYITESYPDLSLILNKGSYILNYNDTKLISNLFITADGISTLQELLRDLYIDYTNNSEIKMACLDGIYTIINGVWCKKEDYIEENIYTDNTIYLQYLEGKLNEYTLKTDTVDIEEIYNNIYVTDGVLIFLYKDKTLNSVSFDVALLDNSKSTNIHSTSISTQESFSLCKLKQCYFNIAAFLLHKYCPMHCEDSNFKELILKRDILWMAINTITYLLEKSNFQEAQRIKEEFDSCNDFCKDTLNKDGRSSCGCNSNN